MTTKKILLILSLAIGSQMLAQIEYGILEYKVKVGTDDLFESFDKTLAEQYIKEKESEKYILEFDTEKSVFFHEGGLAISGYSKPSIIYFKEKDSLYSLKPIDDEDFGKLIVEEDRNTEWIFHNESKMIGDYKCYKATSTYQLELGDNNYHTFPIVAWYAPSIPMPFGPLGYGNLPGLILELHERIDIYGVEKIKINIEKDQKKSKLKKPIVGKRISKNELNLKIRAFYKKRP